MKKIIVLIISALCFVACQESKEEKAEKLIKKAFNSIIVNIDTYEPIETTVDSAFAPMQTAETFQIIENTPSRIILYQELKDQMERTQSLMAIYESPYSSYDKTQYMQYKEKYETAKKKLADMDEKSLALEKKFDEMSKQEPVFNGYLVRHKYRYVNKDGNKTIGEYLFLMNKELTEIEATIDLEDENIKAMIEGVQKASILE